MMANFFMQNKELDSSDDSDELDKYSLKPFVQVLRTDAKIKTKKQEYRQTVQNVEEKMVLGL